MDFRFTEEQEMLRNKVRKFAEEKPAPMAAAVDESDEVSWEMVKLMAQQDLFRLLVPEEYGGTGMKSTTNCIVREELSTISIHADLYFAEMALTAYPLGTYGTDVRRVNTFRRWRRARSWVHLP